METKLHKTVLISGAATGIGKALALKFGAMGANVIVHHHHKQNQLAVKIAAEINAHGGKAKTLAADLLDSNQVLELAQKAWDSFGQIDFLINNAGVSYKKDFLAIDTQDLDAFFNLNFRATLQLTQLIAKQMIAKSIPGNIATITSINAIKPGKGFSAYGASKGALETLMKGAALELAEYQIQVNTFALGAIKTAMNEETWSNPEKLKPVTDHIPLKRFGTAEEVANTICNLMIYGTYVTGTTITIDGGWTLK